MGSLFFAIVIVPATELWLLGRLAARVGFLPVFAYAILAAVIGVMLAAAQGQRAVRELSSAMSRGSVPQHSVISSVLVLFAALLLIVPGVLTDLCAVLLLLPITRHAIAEKVAARFGMPPQTPSATRNATPAAKRARRATPQTEVGRVYVREGDVIDTTGEEVDV